MQNCLFILHSLPRQCLFTLRSMAYVLLCILCFVLAPQARAEDKHASFVIRADVSTRSFLPNTPQHFAENQSKVVIHVSTNGWLITAQTTDQRTGYSMSKSSMTVPGGVRSYTQFEHGPTNAAIAASLCPLAYPPPTELDLFVTWLSLCPSPQLPLINGTSMWLFADVPGCQASIVSNSFNVGRCALRWSVADPTFLESLMITNSGHRLTILNDGEPGVMHLEGPFKSGVLELAFTVIEHTNVMGVSFPLATVMSHWSLGTSVAGIPEIYVSYTTSLNVRSIEMLEHGIQTKDESAPLIMVAFDQRFANLHSNQYITYLVTNDTWKATGDPDMEWRSGFSNASGRRKLSSRLITLSLLLLVIVPPILMFLFQSTKKQQTAIE